MNDVTNWDSLQHSHNFNCWEIHTWKRAQWDFLGWSFWRACCCPLSPVQHLPTAFVFLFRYSPHWWWQSVQMQTFFRQDAEVKPTHCCCRCPRLALITIAGRKEAARSKIAPVWTLALLTKPFQWDHSKRRRPGAYWWWLNGNWHNSGTGISQDVAWQGTVKVRQWSRSQKPALSGRRRWKNCLHCLRPTLSSE